MRAGIREFYKRFHKIDSITENMEIDIDCMEKLANTIMKISVEKLEDVHGPLRDDKAYLAVEHYLISGTKD